MTKILKIFIALLALTGFATFSVSLAQEGSSDKPSAGGFIAVPANPNTVNKNRFLFEVKPGEKINDVLFIENQSNEKMNLKIYGTEKTETTDTFAFKTPDEKLTNIGQWITIENEVIQLNPGEHAFVNFELSSPKDAELKNYEGAIAIEKQATGSSENLTILTRIAVRIDLKVTQTPNPPEKLFKEKPFFEKVNKTHLALAGILFLASGSYLIYSYHKEKSAKSQRKL